MLTMKALSVRPPVKSSWQRRTNGTRMAPPARRFSSFGTPMVSGILQHHAVVSRAAGDPLAVEVLEERDRVLPREPEELLEGGHLDLRPRGPALPDPPLQRGEVVRVDEEGVPHAAEDALGHENPGHPVEKPGVPA